MNFRTYASINAALFLVLAAVWLFIPAQQLVLWQVAVDEPALLVGRRLAAWYLGVGVMFLFARNAAPSAARTALLAGFVVACLVVGALGVMEWLSGHAGAAILSPVVVEFSLAVAGLILLRGERPGSAESPQPADAATPSQSA